MPPKKNKVVSSNKRKTPKENRVKFITALLVKPGNETKTEVVEISTNSDQRLAQMQKYIGGYVQMLPRATQVRPIFFEEKGKVIDQYNFDVWVDEEGIPKGLEQNSCAEFSYSILGAFSCPIFGNALLIEKGRNLTIDDWKKIGQATYYNQEMATKNLNGFYKKSK
jgi:hypothetical protein